MDRENRLMVARGRGWGMGKMGESGQREQTFSHKINNAQACTDSPQLKDGST